MFFKVDVDLTEDGIGNHKLCSVDNKYSKQHVCNTENTVY